MVNIKITSLLKLYTLILLSKKPMHGYEIIKELEKCAIQKISASHVYPFLALLKKNNLIILNNLGNREKKQYALTSEGRKFVNEMLNKFSIMVDAGVRRKVKKCAHCDCQIYEGGYKEKINGKMFNFCCMHCAKSLKKLTKNSVISTV